MKRKPRALILDDDGNWLMRHKEALEKEGYECVVTRESKEALRILKSGESFEFAVLDEILMDPEKERWQNVQGLGVAKYLKGERPDVPFFLVTEKPYVEAKKMGQNDIDTLLRAQTRERRRLEKESGAIRLLHKHEIDDSEGAAYTEIVKLFRSQPRPSTVKLPAVYCARQLDRDMLVEVLESSIDSDCVDENQLRSLKQQQGYEWFRAREVLSWIVAADAPDLWGGLMKSSRPSYICIKEVGSSKLRKVDDLGPKTRYYRILSYLAEQAAQRLPVEITDDVYQAWVDTEKKRRPRGRDRAVVTQDQAAEILQEERGSVSYAPQQSLLKTPVCRLNEALGGGRRWFRCDDGVYKPLFNTDIVFCREDYFGK